MVMSFILQVAKYKDVRFNLFSRAPCFPCVPALHGKSFALKVSFFSFRWHYSFIKQFSVSLGTLKPRNIKHERTYDEKFGSLNPSLAA